MLRWILKLVTASRIVVAHDTRRLTILRWIIKKDGGGLRDKGGKELKI